MTKPCEICHEKQTRINALLKGMKRDKKFYRIIILVSILLNILMAAFGKAGIQMAMDFAKGIIR